MPDLFLDTSQYLLMPKRYFARFACGYEILPIELCYQYDGKYLLTKDDVLELNLAQKADDKMLVIELDNHANESFPFISYSSLKAIGFVDEESKQDFLDKEYSNNDYQGFYTFILPVVQSKVIEAPRNFDKNNFIEKNAEIDAIICLLAKKEDKLDKGSFHIKDKDSLLSHILGLQSYEKKYQKTAISFFNLCVKNNVDSGWNPKAILDELIKQIQPIKLGKWEDTVKSLLNYDSTDFNYSDDNENARVLRAITLVLFNPNLKSLDAMKSNPSKNIGDFVYRLAKQFVFARFGYSFLSTEEKRAVGDNRKLLQDINAFLNNQKLNPSLSFDDFTKKNVVIAENKNNVPSLEAEIEVASELADSKVTITDSDITSPEFILSEIDYLAESMVEIEGFDVFDIKDLVSYAGFCARLIVNQQSNQLYYWFIDTREGEGKYKGKFISQLIDIQSKLPHSFRFEKLHLGACFSLFNEKYSADKLKDDLILINKQFIKSELKVINDKKSNLKN